MKKSLLALAVSLVAVSGAHAAWDPANAVSNIVGNGETLFYVFDENPADQVGFVQDLGSTANGVGYDALKANATNTSYNLSFNLASLGLSSVFANANVSDLRWGIITLHNGAIGGDASGPAQALGVQFTSNANPVASGAATGTITNTVVSAAQNSAIQLANFVNGADTTYSANNSTVGTPATGNYFGATSVLGRTLEGSLPVDTTAGVGSSLSYYQFEKCLPSGRTACAPIATTFAGQWSLSLGATGSELTYTTTPTVPVPAAAWLMGSALVGLGSIARRRRV